MVTKFIRKETLDIDSVRTMCIKNDFYTRGTCEEYDNMFRMCSEYNGEVGKLVEIAKDIVNHSDISVFDPDCTTKEILISVMSMLVNECEIIQFEYKEEYV